jgi:hypothetical protein
MINSVNNAYAMNMNFIRQNVQQSGNVNEEARENPAQQASEKVEETPSGNAAIGKFLNIKA